MTNAHRHAQIILTQLEAPKEKGPPFLALSGSPFRPGGKFKIQVVSQQSS